MYKLLNLRLTVKLINLSEDTRKAMRASSRLGIVFYSCILLLVHILSITKFHLTPLKIMTKEFQAKQGDSHQIIVVEESTV